MFCLKQRLRKSQIKHRLNLTKSKPKSARLYRVTQVDPYESARSISYLLFTSHDSENLLDCEIANVHFSV